MSPPLEPSPPLVAGIRKRVCKACDRCRLKKSKCESASPCSRCKADNAICVFAERKKSLNKAYPKGYVEMLERQQVQLVAGLQELYKRLQNGQGWPGATLRETSDGMPLTHDILERLGALRQNSNAKHDTFEDAFSGLQQRPIADGDDLTQRQPLHDSNPHPDSSAPSTIHEPVAQKPNFTNPFNLEPAPATPRSQTPYPQLAQHIHCMQMHIRLHVINMPSDPSWNNPLSALDSSMDFGSQFDSQMMDWPVDGTAFFLNAFRGHKTPAAINPHLTMYDWAGQEDPQQYLNSAMLT